AELVAYVREERRLRAVELGECLGALALGLIRLCLADRAVDLLGDQIYERFVRFAGRAPRAQARHEKPREPLLARALERHGERLPHEVRPRLGRDAEPAWAEIVDLDAPLGLEQLREPTRRLGEIEHAGQRRLPCVA